MKTLLTTCAIAALTLAGSTPKVAAGGLVSGGYIQLGGYRSCDAPGYTERYFIGYDAWGNPVWGYRTRYVAPRYVVPVCPPPRCYAPPLGVPPPGPYPHHRSHGAYYGPYSRR